jgi:hypothetical protein
MTYRVDRYNGTFLTSVAPGTVDSTTDLKFIGQNYSGYGEVQNENFLHLLENFANTTEPSKPISGQIWYDSGNKKLKFYDGAKFKTASGPEVSGIAPSGLTPGDLWFDTTTSQLSVWTGTEFVTIGPQSAPGFGTSQIITQVVKDTNNASHVILRAVVGGITTAIFSNDTSFTLSDTNQISGFSLADNRINKGVTLNSVDSEGVSDASAAFKFWGTSTNSERLGGLAVSEFVRRSGDSLGFTTRTSFGDPGLVVGSRNDLGIYVGTTSPIIENFNNGPLRIRISNAASTEDFDDMMIVTRSAFSGALATAYPATTIAPGQTNRINFGSSERVWRTVYATNLYGNLTGNITGNSTGIHQGSIKDSLGNTAYDSVAREFSASRFIGNLTGNISGNAGSSDTARKLETFEASTSANPGVASIPVRSAAGVIAALRFQGVADDSLTLDTRSPSYNKDPDTVVIRNNFGDIEARFVNGTATSANYADLAEIYKTDKEYGIGTVISVGGLEEVTESKFGDRAIGVISENPAYLMNSEAEGQAVALKGRVPVKVVGAVRKGDRLIAADNGTATTITELGQKVDVFAIALESSDLLEEKLIEAIIL